ncbi:MAG TPA: hypothetical protein V6D22_19940 [Candidatus Obscuribacterales bacterium]
MLRSSIIGIKHLMWLTIVVSLLIGFYFFDKLDLNWMVIMYGLGAIIIGVLVFAGDLEKTFLVKDKDTKLGASYWGVYEGQSFTNEETTVQPPKPCKDIEGIAGSGAYAGGQAVKSAR